MKLLAHFRKHQSSQVPLLEFQLKQSDKQPYYKGQCRSHTWPYFADTS